MVSGYDNYYQTEELFGQPYKELIAFYATYTKRGTLLDIGCGQGRDSLAIARLGYEVVGIDTSALGIAQLNEKAANENLKAKGIVQDMYAYDDFAGFDFVLLDSMFHFTKKDRMKEINFIKKLLTECDPKTIITFCVQNVGEKLATLNATLGTFATIERVHEASFKYHYSDDASGHVSTTDYSMIVVTL